MSDKGVKKVNTLNTEQNNKIIEMYIESFFGAWYLLSQYSVYSC